MHHLTLRRFERGKINWSNLIFFVLLFLIIYVAIKMIPAYVDAYKLIDTVDEIARFPGNMKEKQIKNQIMDKARELNIPLDRRNIEVKLMDTETRISIDFEIKVVFPGYVYKKRFRETKIYPRF